MRASMGSLWVGSPFPLIGLRKRLGIADGDQILRAILCPSLGIRTEVASLLFHNPEHSVLAEDIGASRDPCSPSRTIAVHPVAQDQVYDHPGPHKMDPPGGPKSLLFWTFLTPFSSHPRGSKIQPKNTFHGEGRHAFLCP